MNSQKKLILTKMIVSLIFGVLFGAALILIGNVVSVSSLIKWAIINVNEKKGIVELIFSGLGILMGLIMVFMHNDVITAIVAVYLVIIPVVEIILSKDKKNTLKGEWLRILIGVLLIIFLPAIFGAADTIFKVVLMVCGIAFIGLSVISFLISLYGFLKKPASDKIIETTATDVSDN